MADPGTPAADSSSSAAGPDVGAGLRAADPSSSFLKSLEGPGAPLERSERAVGEVAKESAGHEAQVVDMLTRMPWRVDQSKLPEVKAPTTQAAPSAPQPREALQNFGSVASVLGILGGALLKAPISASLGASAAAMQAANTGDWARYKTEYQKWKDQTELAWKQADFQAKAFDRALDVMKTDMGQGQAMAKMMLDQFHYSDEAKLKLALMPEQFGELGQKMQEQGLKLKEEAAKVKVQGDLLEANANLQEARKTGDPEKIKEAQSAYDNAQEMYFNVLAPVAASHPLTTAQQDAELRRLDTEIASLEKSDPNNPELPALRQRRDAMSVGARTLSDVKAGVETINPEDPQVQARASMLAAGAPRTTIVAAFGGKVGQAEFDQLQGLAIKQIMNENPGMDAAAAGRELAQRQIDFAAGRSATTFADRMLTSTRQAVAQLDFNIEQTKKALRDIPSSDLSPVVNALARGEQFWTGDPRYSNLFFYMHATALESARILQGAQATVAQLHAGAAEEAKKWADANWTTPKAFIEGAAPAMEAESKKRLETFEQAVQSARQLGPQFGKASGSSAGGAATYASPDDVYKAVDAGTLSKDAAKKILMDQFGFKEQSK